MKPSTLFKSSPKDRTKAHRGRFVHLGIQKNLIYFFKTKIRENEMSGDDRWTSDMIKYHTPCLHENNYLWPLVCGLYVFPILD